MHRTPLVIGHDALFIVVPVQAVDQRFAQPVITGDGRGHLPAMRIVVLQEAIKRRGCEKMREIACVNGGGQLLLESLKVVEVAEHRSRTLVIQPDQTLRVPGDKSRKNPALVALRIPDRPRQHTLGLQQRLASTNRLFQALRDARNILRAEQDARVNARRRQLRTERGEVERGEVVSRCGNNRPAGRLALEELDLLRSGK